MTHQNYVFVYKASKMSGRTETQHLYFLHNWVRLHHFLLLFCLTDHYSHPRLWGIHWHVLLGVVPCQLAGNAAALALLQSLLVTGSGFNNFMLCGQYKPIASCNGNSEYWKHPISIITKNQENYHTDEQGLDAQILKLKKNFWWNVLWSKSLFK